MRKKMLILLPLTILSTSVYLTATDFHPLHILHSEHIDSALAKIKMERQDITFNLIDKPDTFRLQLINRLFNKPLATFNVCDSIAEYHFKHLTHLDSLLIFNSQLLDIDIGINKPSKTTPQENILHLESLHPVNQQIIRQSLVLLPTIFEKINHAFQPLTDEERNFLEEYGREYFEQDEDVQDKTLREIHEAEEKSRDINKQLGEYAAKIDQKSLIEAALAAIDLISTIDNLLSSTSDSLYTDDHFFYPTKYGDILINPKERIPLDQAVIIIDYGSDNTYNLKETNTFRLILDYGGNDKYVGESFCQGGGYWGVDILIDFAGDDFYYAKNHAQGSGYFGIGILCDLAGDDTYKGENMVQGTGAFGIGLLCDSTGNDLYECCLSSQGFGYTGGFGGLIDGNGNDNYIVQQKHVDILRYDEHFESLSQGAGFGIRPYYSGGIGILADQKGNDNYLSDIFGQGVGYWYAIGGLIDKDGHDRYLSYQYAQGAGIHLAFGVLIDYNGNDNYAAKGVSQGCGHDYAFGGLYDFCGNDNYICYDLSQGGGNANAISVFIDAYGDDGYIAKRANTMGYSDKRRGFGYIGLFLDLRGNDYYGSPLGGNNQYWIHSTYGIGIDSENAYLDSLVTQKEYDMEPADEPIGFDIETLFMQASAASQKFQYLVQPARERIVAMGDSAMSFLVGKLDTESAREQHTLIAIIPEIGKPALPYLEKVLSDSIPEKIPITLLLLGKIKEEKSFQSIAKYTQVSNPSYRVNAIKALSDLGSTQAIPILISGLQDSIVAVRRESAIALQKIPSEKAILPLIDATNDEFQEVRYAAEEALISIGETADSYVQKMYPTSTLRSKKHLISYCAKVLTNSNYQFLELLSHEEDNEELLKHVLDAKSAYYNKDISCPK